MVLRTLGFVDGLFVGLAVVATTVSDVAFPVVDPPVAPATAAAVGTAVAVCVTALIVVSGDPVAAVSLTAVANVGPLLRGVMVVPVFDLRGETGGEEGLVGV